MVLRLSRVWAGLALVCSGVLLYAASWQRWATGPCGDGGTASACELRQDHRFDFLPPADPWEPVGRAAELGGLSLLVLALAVPVLPWALAGRRPGVVTAVAVVAAEAALVSVAVGAVRSGLDGAVRPTLLGEWSVTAWVLVLPAVLVRLSVAAHGWARGAAIALVLGTPLVAAFSYAPGPYDAQPWWEALAGCLTATGGVCLLVAAARRPRTLARPAPVDVPVTGPALPRSSPGMA